MKRFVIVPQGGLNKVIVRICGSPGRATASGHPAIVEPVTPPAYPPA
jgi:hypothetical protein